MTDIVDRKTRSKMMSSIRSKNTGIEVTIRKLLWKRGFRYRLHDSKLPGKPDIVFPKFHAVIFINGCFWHGHDCHLFRLPKSRTEFWRKKIGRNKNNSVRFYKSLSQGSWRILTVWECAIRGKSDACLDEVIDTISKWLYSSVNQFEVMGK